MTNTPITPSNGADRRRTPYKRVSANLPKHWLNAPPYCDLSDAAWRLYTHSLMWSIDTTDGRIPLRILSVLLLGVDDAARHAAVGELVDAGLCVQTADGWLIPDWAQHQSLKEVIESHRSHWRDSKRRQRARAKLNEQNDNSTASANDVPPGRPPWTPLAEYERERNGKARDATKEEAQSARHSAMLSSMPTRQCEYSGCDRQAVQSQRELGFGTAGKWCVLHHPELGA